MTMVFGPWFFGNFGGGWRFTANDGATRAVWKYTFSWPNSGHCPLAALQHPGRAAFTAR